MIFALELAMVARIEHANPQKPFSVALLWRTYGVSGCAQMVHRQPGILIHSMISHTASKHSVFCLYQHASQLVGRCALFGN